LKRKGFSLFLAIVVLVVVSTLSALMISLSSSSAKQTADIYLKEQAELLAQSATEYAILAILGHDNRVNCLENIHITYPSSSSPMFDVNISLWYITDATQPPSSCSQILSSSLSAGSNSHMSVLVDTVVSSSSNLNISEPIRIHRRTIQKP